MNYKRQYSAGKAATEVSASTLGVKGPGVSAPRIPQGFVGLVMFNQGLGCVYSSPLAEKYRMATDTEKNRLPEAG